MCLVHPFSTLLRCDFAHIALYDCFEQICECCQTHQTAIELNESQIQSCLVQPAPQLMDHPDIPSKRDFYHQLIKISQKYDLHYSTGSDAHVLDSVGKFVNVKEILQQFQIPAKKIIHLPQIK